MANRRMFSKSITNSSQFLMMPQSSQALYFHFGMNADDDGFCEHFSIMRMTESKPDDLKVLQAHHFVDIFDDKVLVITDWKENNYLRPDRYVPSKYLAIYNKELKLITKNGMSSGIPKPNQRYTEVRLVKDRKGKDRKEDPKHTILDNLSFTTKEEEKIKERWGADGWAWITNKLSSYKLAHGKNYTSDYGAVNQWVADAWLKHKGETSQQSSGRKITTTEELEKKYGSKLDNTQKV